MQHNDIMSNNFKNQTAISLLCRYKNNCLIIASLQRYIPLKNWFGVPLNNILIEMYKGDRLENYQSQFSSAFTMNEI